MKQRFTDLLAQMLAGVIFYTCIPVPADWRLEWRGVARMAVLVGVLIGALLALLDGGLAWIGFPVLTRSGVVVAAWLALTGGLHLDGVMDTADGLAVTDPQRRLQVMADSATGAFGAMAAGVLLLLKTIALADLSGDRGWALIAAAGWGRWGQQVAIARYPYLKPTGKGEFHKQAIRSLWDTLPSFVLLIGVSGAAFWWSDNGKLALAMVGFGSLMAIFTGAWFHHKLGGHTGDTYGAVVEWTEAGVLCLLTLVGH